jgi:hypothetical protein
MVHEWLERYVAGGSSDKPKEPVGAWAERLGGVARQAAGSGRRCRAVPRGTGSRKLATSETTARLEREAQAEREALRQAEAHEVAEIEMKERGAIVILDQLGDPTVTRATVCVSPPHDGRVSGSPKFATMNAKNRPSLLEGASQDPVSGELISGQTRSELPGRRRVQLGRIRRPMTRRSHSPDAWLLRQI